LTLLAVVLLFAGVIVAGRMLLKRREARATGSDGGGAVGAAVDALPPADAKGGA
jgi:hypothetical protein